MYVLNTVISTGSGQTLQQTPKIPGSAEIMRNQVTEPIVAYLLLPYLMERHGRYQLIRGHMSNSKISMLKHPNFFLDTITIKIAELISGT